MTPFFLGKGFDVTVLDNLMFGQAPLLDCCIYPGFDFIKGDICDDGLLKTLLPKFDIIIPLAAIVGRRPASSTRP